MTEIKRSLQYLWDYYRYAALFVLVLILILVLGIRAISHNKSQH